MVENIEVMFAKEFLRKLKLQEEDCIHYMTSSALPQDEYHIQIGLLRGIRATKVTFEELLKAYFKNN